MSTSPKILLILPPSFLYPMGAAYVAATLERAGYDYDIYGFFYDNRAWFKRNCVSSGGISTSAVCEISARMSQESLFELIARERYDYVLAGGLVGFFRWFYLLLPQVKGYSPGCTIIMGGGITKDLPENTIFEKLDVDYILKGEAETNLGELLAVLSKGSPAAMDLLTIPGLCWKDETSAIRRNATVRIDPAKTAQLPAWDSFHIHEYIALSDTLLRFNMTFFPILAGRGCPNVCAFCSPSIGSFTPCSVDSVISEMRHWTGKFNFDFFFLYSEVAFDDEDYTIEFCRKYKQEINKPWVGQLRTDVHFSVETYRAMKDAGCMFICLGFESACDRVLKVMKKRTTLDDHQRNLSQAREAGLNVFGNFMFGHESETAEEIKETFDFINRYDLISGPSNGLASIIIYPGTAYYRTAERKGLIDNPFKFLLSYSMKAAISYVDIRDKNDASVLNISALSNDEFYEVICSENIKHRRLYSKRHAAVDVERFFELGAIAGFIFAGKCPTCGRLVKFDVRTYQNPLSVTKLCDGCYYTVVVDIYQFYETKAYLEEFRTRLAASSRIVVYGSWIMDLIFSGAINFPYHKIIAWVDPENPEVSNKRYVYHLPQLSLKELKEYDYDTIIALKPHMLATRQIIKEQGLNPDAAIITPLPDTLNTVIAEMMRGKKIALAGASERVTLARALLTTGRGVGALEHLGTIQDICSSYGNYDFIVFDPNEFHIDRQELAQRSRYLIQEILHVQFLLDGGYYTGC